jgi:hypothetical protein
MLHLHFVACIQEALNENFISVQRIDVFRMWVRDVSATQSCLYYLSSQDFDGASVSASIVCLQASLWHLLRNAMMPFSYHSVPSLSVVLQLLSDHAFTVLISRFYHWSEMLWQCFSCQLYISWHNPCAHLFIFMFVLFQIDNTNSLLLLMCPNSNCVHCPCDDRIYPLSIWE